MASLTLKALRRILRTTDLGSRRLAASTGLTLSQLLVLREINLLEEATPSVVAANLQFSQATISVIVDRLEARNFVTRKRSEKDRRRFILTITDEGKSALSQAPDPLQLSFTDRFSHLPRWEQAMILASVEKLANVLGAEEMDAAPLLDSGRIDRSEPI